MLLCRKNKKIMNTALFVWCLIAGMTLGACLTALVMKIGARHGAAAHAPVQRHARRRFVSIGTEREEFFIPGDPLEKDDDYDDDEL